jgi:branched-chain amino acid transport system substrate-binding protein
MSHSSRAALLATAFALALTGSALADPKPIRIGVTLSTTGPASALGIPQKNTLDLVAKEIAGHPVEVVVLDDGGDAGAATTNARRFVTEDKVDVLIGSSTTGGAIAVAGVAQEAETPLFVLSPIPFAPGREKWTFSLPQPAPLMARGLFEDMKKRGVKTVGLIAFNDGWGDLWAKELKAQGEALGLSTVAEERYARPDTSVTGQALKILAAKPDAVLVGGSGTAAALPAVTLRERGYAGRIYQTHGAVTRDFIRIAGKAAEGQVFVSGPVVVAAQQPDTSPTKAAGLAYTAAYEAKYGKGSVTLFGTSIWDAFEILKQTIPEAAKASEPGTPAFRDALRKALESGKGFAGAQAVYTYTPTDHYGIDERGRILVTVKAGDWAPLD